MNNLFLESLKSDLGFDAWWLFTLTKWQRFPYIFIALNANNWLYE